MHMRHRAPCDVPSNRAGTRQRSRAPPRYTTIHIHDDISRYPAAIIAILTEEDDAARYATAIAAADVRKLSAASYLECGIVLDSLRDPIISRGLDELLDEAGFVVEPVTERQVRLARQAYADFGKGSGQCTGHRPT